MFITGCEQNNLNKNSINLKTFDKYKNTGFGLVYDSSLKNKKKITKKIDNRSLLIFHIRFHQNNNPVKLQFLLLH
jgi:hypothetical protein